MTLGMAVDESTRMFEAPVAAGGVKRDRAYLVVLAGASVGEMYKIETEKTVIGRGQRAQIRLFDDGISREHAQILIEALRVGTVNIWEVPGYRIEMSPFGGIKDSGNGIKEGVVEAMKYYTNVKTFSLPWPVA